MKYLFCFLLSAISFFGNNGVFAFDLKGATNALKNVNQRQAPSVGTSQEKTPDSAAVDKGGAQAANYYNFLYRYFQANKTVKPEDVVLGYWNTLPDNNYNSVKNDDFKFGDEKKKIETQFKANIEKATSSTLTFQTELGFGKYDIGKKSYLNEGFVDENNLLLKSRTGKIWKVAPMSAVMSMVDEGDKTMLPFYFEIKISNSKSVQYIPVAEDIARKISAVPGGHGAKAVLTFSVDKIQTITPKGTDVPYAIAIVSIKKIDLFDRDDGKTPIGSFDIK